eukprot:CAMPEP_0196802032 /NCGR_PEP_ID=MMETSP1362-20130617/1763_1 /TAXON_ID=163516 /ORGANISM="Leptocylindrus danicus, Strain CCMP1856" /LENGTH=41 /DNA_ID= /DNA_START= /DNA_END= /DNA_ORIENTATION=
MASALSYLSTVAVRDFSLSNGGGYLRIPGACAFEGNIALSR